MSIEALVAAMYAEPPAGARNVSALTSYRVLLALAEHADEYGEDAFPSIRTLGEALGVKHNREVENALANLVAQGRIVKTAPAVPRKRGATYRIALDQPADSPGDTPGESDWELDRGTRPGNSTGELDRGTRPGIPRCEPEPEPEPDPRYAPLSAKSAWSDERLERAEKFAQTIYAQVRDHLNADDQDDGMRSLNGYANTLGLLASLQGRTELPSPPDMYGLKGRNAIRDAYANTLGFDDYDLGYDEEDLYGDRGDPAWASRSDWPNIDLDEAERFAREYEPQPLPSYEYFWDQVAGEEPF